MESREHKAVEGLERATPPDSFNPLFPSSSGSSQSRQTIREFDANRWELKGTLVSTAYCEVPSTYRASTDSIVIIPACDTMSSDFLKPYPALPAGIRNISLLSSLLQQNTSLSLLAFDVNMHSRETNGAGISAGNTGSDYRVEIDTSIFGYTPRKLRVVCIGSGFSGLTLAYKIQHSDQDLSFVDFTIYEKNTEVGGTWLENKYPGVAW